MRIPITRGCFTRSTAEPAADNRFPAFSATAEAIPLRDSAGCVHRFVGTPARVDLAVVESIGFAVLDIG
jgi:hypothetical protein